MNLNVTIQSPLWQAQSLDIEAILRAVLSRLGEENPRDVAVVLSDDLQIQALNRDFRGKDKPTNVLSFPSDEDDEWGDIILAHGTITREADEQGKVFEAHVTHMLVHSMLHLLGYDHARDDEAQKMEALEVAILAQLGVANPYE